MNYKLYHNSPNDINDIQGTVFANRNYKPPNGGFDNNVNSFELLKNMGKAVELFEKFKKDSIGILVD